MCAIGQNVLMVRLGSTFVVSILSLLLLPLWASAEEIDLLEQEVLEWAQLPEVPGGVGFAGPFLGRSGDLLVVAGGANFPETPLWETAKSWYGDIHVLDLNNPDAGWRHSGWRVPARGYGVSISAPEGLLFIGGSDGTSHFSDVFVF